MENAATMRAGSARFRDLLGKVLLAPIAYFLLAAMANFLWETNPRIAITLLFAAGLLGALWLKPAFGFLAWQWDKSRAGMPWLSAAMLSGALFYLATFFLKATDGSRILEWSYSAEYLLLSGLAIPFVEEFLFRGVAIGRASGRDAWIAATLAAVCFAMIHPDRWLGTFIFSLVAAAFYLRGGIGAAWGFHAAYNLANYAALLWFSANNA